MSTRCHVELWDAWYKDAPIRGMNPHGSKTILTKLGVRLYHHSDGYPSFMRPKLKKFLPAAYEYLKEAGYSYWWDSERVAAVLIALSIEDYSEPLKPFSTDRDNRYVSCVERGDSPERPYRTNGGVPVFQPCMEIHGDVEYIWKVTLGPEEGAFKISYRTPTMKELGYTDEEIETRKQRKAALAAIEKKLV